MGRILAAYSPDKPLVTMPRYAAAEFLDLLASRPPSPAWRWSRRPPPAVAPSSVTPRGRRCCRRRPTRGRDDTLEVEAIPATAGRAALAGAESLIVGQIVAGNAARLRELLPDIVYITDRSSLPRPGRGAAPVSRGRKAPSSTRRLNGWRAQGGRSVPLSARASPAAAGGGRPLPARATARGGGAVVAAKGYAAMTIGDLTKEAGVSCTTFYQLYPDKEACVLAAYDNAVEVLVRRVLSAHEAEREWPERAAAGLTALLALLAAEPDLARLSLVDIGNAGPGAQRRYRAAVQRLTPLFDEGRDFASGGRALPANTSRMAIGASPG